MQGETEKNVERRSKKMKTLESVLTILIDESSNPIFEN